MPSYEYSIVVTVIAENREEAADELFVLTHSEEFLRLLDDHEVSNPVVEVYYGHCGGSEAHRR